MIPLLAFLAVLTCIGASEGQSPFVQSTWRDTIYYRATYDAAEAGQALFNVAAVDSYEVFFNGDPVGSDAVGTRMAAHEVGIAILPKSAATGAWLGRRQQGTTSAAE